MKKLICLFIVFTAVFSITASATTVIDGKTITANGACVIDFHSGEMLFGFNENKRMVPASMTKVMALYVIYDAIKAGKITLETVVPISEYVYKSSRNPVGSNVPLYYNRNYTVDQMIDMIAVASACACVEAMAELTYGGIEGFRRAMNDKAAALGLNAVYYSITGIGDNYISPHSMAWLTKSIITDHPEILERTSKKSVSLNGASYLSTNKLLSGSYFYSGADGFKTGTSSNAGFCFTGTAERDGKRVVAVAMQSASASERFSDVIKMLDYGFSKIHNEKSEKPPQKVLQTTYHDAIMMESPMPTFVYGYDNLNCFAVIAEDLQCYGYDASYNSETGVLTLTHNPQKNAEPINTEYYKSFPEYYSLFKVWDTDKTIEIIKDGTTYSPNIILDLNGYMAIGIDDDLVNFLGIYVK